MEQTRLVSNAIKSFEWLEIQSEGCGSAVSNKARFLLPPLWHPANTNTFQVVIVLQLLYWGWQDNMVQNFEKLIKFSSW